jgi:hypothetical protein
VGFCLFHVLYWYSCCIDMNAVEISYSVALLAVYKLTYEDYTISCVHGSCK